jgi:hypothetical protein
VHIELRNGHASVLDANNCQELDVVTAPGADHDQVTSQLATSGVGAWLDDTTIALDVQRLHTLASSAVVEAHWQERWDAMLAHAATKGWLSQDGAKVFAHLAEHPQSPDA